MFKKLLNSPWFVVSLCVVATGYLGLVVGKPMFTDDAAAFDASDIPDPFDLTVAETEDDTTVGSVSKGRHIIGDRSNITWLEDPKRDPFIRSVVKAVSTGVMSGGQESKLEGPPRLTAVFVGGLRRSAVIDDELVSLGEETGNGYRVTAIEPTRVTVERHNVELHLEPRS